MDKIRDIAFNDNRRFSLSEYFLLFLFFFLFCFFCLLKIALFSFVNYIYTVRT